MTSLGHIPALSVGADVSRFIELENTLFTITVAAYILGMAAYFVYYAGKSNRIHKIASLLIFVGFLFHSAAIIFRGIGAERVPLSNQYEFATAFAWAVGLFLIIMEKKYDFSQLGVFVSPILFLIIGYAAMQNKEVRPLMPALKSGWLVIHVSFAVISYGAFAVACAISIMYLSKARNEAGLTEEASLQLGSELSGLDLMTYRIIMVGYLFLTLTIVTGAIWGQYAWGRFWAWDPKETWSLITWIIYTVYLHMRRTHGLMGRKSARFAILGFLAVIFTFVGVNMLLPSLHSYVVQA